MEKIRILKYPSLIILAVIVGTGLFFLGSKYALDHLSFRQITPTQAANAMKDDHFWSSYRENILLVTGDVISVAKSGNNTIVSFKTDSSYTAECSFTNLNGKVAKSQTIKVTTIANAAERQPAGVKLNNCLLR